MMANLSNIRKEFPSPLWGGLGWGSLRPYQFFAKNKHRPTPTPTLPTRGWGKSYAVIMIEN